MANGLPKRVVFKKPRIDPKIVDLRAKAEEPPKIKPKLQPERRIKPVDKPQPEPITHIEEPVLEISEEEPQEIIHTKSKRTIIIKREPLPQKQLTASDTLIIGNSPQNKTFDEKFLDKMNIKSRITKDTKTLEKITKPETKPTLKNKIKQKPKKKLNLTTLIILIIFIIVTYWTYKVINDYLLHKLDGSLASFMYIVINILMVIITFIWLIIEITMENKNEKR